MPTQLFFFLILLRWIRTQVLQEHRWYHSWPQLGKYFHQSSLGIEKRCRMLILCRTCNYANALLISYITISIQHTTHISHETDFWLDFHLVHRPAPHSLTCNSFIGLYLVNRLIPWSQHRLSTRSHSLIVKELTPRFDLLQLIVLQTTRF